MFISLENVDLVNGSTSFLMEWKYYLAEYLVVVYSIMFYEMALVFVEMGFIALPITVVDRRLSSEWLT